MKKDFAKVAFWIGIGLSTASFAVAFIALAIQQSVTSQQLGVAKENISHGRSIGEQVVLAQIDAFTMALALNACGVYAGLALAVLALSLFLIGVRGSLSATGETGTHKIQLENLSPGLFVLLLSALLIGTCIILRPKLELSSEQVRGVVQHKDKIEAGYKPPPVKTTPP